MFHCIIECYGYYTWHNFTTKIIVFRADSINIFKVANIDKSLVAKQLYKYDHNRDFSFCSCMEKRVVAWESRSKLDRRRVKKSMKRDRSVGYRCTTKLFTVNASVLVGMRFDMIFTFDSQETCFLVTFQSTIELVFDACQSETRLATILLSILFVSDESRRLGTLCITTEEIFP